MRISPEPLSPLRNWRELWHAEPLPFAGENRERSTPPEGFARRPKRSAFHWLSHLFARESHR